MLVLTSILQHLRVSIVEGVSVGCPTGAPCGGNRLATHSSRSQSLAKKEGLFVFSFFLAVA